MATHTLNFTSTFELTHETKVGQRFESGTHRAGDFLFSLVVYPKGSTNQKSLHAYLRVIPAVSSSLEWLVAVSQCSIGLKAQWGQDSKESFSQERTFSQNVHSRGWKSFISYDQVWGDGRYWCGNCLVFEVTVAGNFASKETPTALQFKKWLTGEALQRMWEEMAYPDMCVIAQGEEIQCHRAVIALASPVFDHMLSSDFLEGHCHQICLQHVASSVVRFAIGFIYTGELPSCEDYDTISGLLDFANMYQLPCLANVCVSRLVGSVKRANIRHVMQLLNFHKDASPEMEDHLSKMLSKVKEDDVLLRAVCFEDGGALVNSRPEQTTTKAISVQTCSPATLEASVLGHPEAVSRNADSAFPSTSIESAVQTESVALSANKSLDQKTVELASDAVSDEDLTANSIKRRSNEQRQLAAFVLSMVYASLADENRTSQRALSKITKVGFNPFSKEFEDALLQSDFVQRLVTRGVDVKPAWANGAKIFVDNVAKASLKQAGVQIGDLRHWHVLVLDEDVQWIESIMRNLMGRKPRVRSAHSVDLSLTSALQDDLDNSEQIVEKDKSCAYDVYVCRSFVHVHEPKMISPRTCYTQSSPDPHVEDCVEIDRRRLNPRVWGVNSEQ